MNKVIDKNILLTAVAQRKLKLVRLLLDGGCDVDYHGYDGKTALMIACCFLQQNDDAKNICLIVDLLLKHGAKTNLQDLNGRTALIHAFRYNASPKAVKLLLEAGADPLICDCKGRNAFCYLKGTSWHTYAACLGEVMSPRQIFEELKDKKYRRNIPVVTVNVASPRQISNNGEEGHFRFPEYRRGSFDPSELRSEYFVRKNRNVTEDAVDKVEIRRQSEGICFKETLSVYKRTSLLTIQSTDICTKNDPLSTEKAQSDLRKTKSAGDIKTFQNMSQTKLESKIKNKSSCDISRVDRNILERGQIVTQRKLPPIEK